MTLALVRFCAATARPASNCRSSERRLGSAVSGSVCDSCCVCSKRVADGTNRAVAGFVAERVVDLLQPIEVEHHDAKAGFRAKGVGDARLDLAIQRATIRQARQRVGMRLVLRLLEAR